MHKDVLNASCPHSLSKTFGFIKHTLIQRFHLTASLAGPILKLGQSSSPISIKPIAQRSLGNSPNFAIRRCINLCQNLLAQSRFFCAIKLVVQKWGNYLKSELSPRLSPFLIHLLALATKTRQV
jgi:hypothetical protein